MTLKEERWVQRQERDWMAEEVDDAEAYERAVRLGAQTSCTEVLDALMFCYSPANQVSTYYQRGTVDGCQEIQSDFFSCLRLKTGAPLKRKEALVKKIFKKGDESPSNQVWQFREDPGKDWLGGRPAAKQSDEQASKTI